MSTKLEVWLEDARYRELQAHAKSQERGVYQIVAEALDQYFVAATQPRSAANRAGGPRDGAAEPGAAGDSPSPVPGARRLKVNIRYTDGAEQDFTYVEDISTRQDGMVILDGDVGPTILVPEATVRFIEVEP